MRPDFVACLLAVLPAELAMRALGAKQWIFQGTPTLAEAAIIRPLLDDARKLRRDNLLIAHPPLFDSLTVWPHLEVAFEDPERGYVSFQPDA